MDAPSCHKVEWVLKFIITVLNWQGKEKKKKEKNKGEVFFFSFESEVLLTLAASLCGFHVSSLHFA